LLQEEELDGSDECTQGNGFEAQTNRGKSSLKFSPVSLASKELDDDVPLSKRNKGKVKDASKPSHKAHRRRLV
jgi:hypothetical protein